MWNYAELNLRLWVNRADNVREVLELVHTGDQNILHAAILELNEHAQPELGTLILGEPHAQQLFLAFQMTPRAW
ncbi:hypothetical protein GCM10027217_15130 [Pseudomaricurvus hydrocarbonicus]